jgi:TetR/AcrR family transcriptional repressor of bet genes
VQTECSCYILVMHSKNSSNDQSPVRSFIEQARRAQIIEATIEVLADYGYINLSFNRIAKHAKISPSLISYHFKDKKELLYEVLMSISVDRIQHVQAVVDAAPTAADKLRVAIEADLAHMGTHPKRFPAIVEVTFNSRDANGRITYMADANDEPQADPATKLLEDIMYAGQKNGEFGDFDVEHAALIIDAARDNFLALLPLTPNADLERFSNNLVDTALMIVKKKETK